MDEAAIKVETAQAVVDKEHSRLEYEEKQRANGMGELRSHADRLGTIRALMEDNRLTDHGISQLVSYHHKHPCLLTACLDSQFCARMLCAKLNTRVEW